MVCRHNRQSGALGFAVLGCPASLLDLTLDPSMVQRPRSRPQAARSSPSGSSGQFGFEEEGFILFADSQLNLVQESLPTKYFPMHGTDGKGYLYLYPAPQKLQVDSMEMHSGLQACGGRSGNGAAAEQIEAKRFGTLTAEVTKVRAGVDMTDDAVATSRAVNDDFHPGIRSAGGWIEVKGNECV
jgi:hypothetical protein